MKKMNLTSAMFILFSLFSMNLSAGDAAKGKELYSACIQCHGENGRGNVEEKAPMIAGQHDWYIVSSIKAFKEGTDRQNEKMLPYINKLSDQDIDDLGAYISQMK